MTDTLKPRIYWTRYPKSKRGYWRVSNLPQHGWRNERVQALWTVAHVMSTQMNAAEDARIMREETLRRARAL